MNIRILTGLALMSLSLTYINAQTPTLSPPPPVPGPQPPLYTPPSAAPAGKPQKLTIAQGTLKGVVANGVGWFLGIPYAPPPVGNLRWMPPGAPPHWSGERDASKAGPVCPAQEDCLYLNVLRPASAHAGQKLPVMVWIHGGAFLGGTSMGGYGGDTDGHEFANKGIVAVSMNYRLGFAGYFSHPALDHEGHLHSNYGALDQIAALKWVKHNIARFGGDPNNVTIYGESAGGFGVLLLMISPEAHGLFNKVIAESSFARARAVPLAIAETNGLKQAEQAGVKGEGAAAAAALRALPISAFPIIRNRPGGFRPFPVLDGQIFPTQVMAGFEAGTEAKVPLIIGGNSNEASLVHPSVAMLDAMPPAKRAAILKIFDPQGAISQEQAINDFITVQAVIEPDRAIARLHTRNGEPTWTYFFSDVPDGLKDVRLYGAAHTEELPFVFISPTQLFGPKDFKLAKAVNAYWASFARTGNPDSAGGVLWPKWSADEGQIEFTPDGPKTRTHFLKEQRDLAESFVGK
ncbi:MAG: carboxylesterase family protein [Acidobacteriaceae bacterium]